MNIKLAIKHDKDQIPTVGKLLSNLCSIGNLEAELSVNQIELAIVELLNNIVNYSENTPAGSWITIHVRLADTSLKVVVSDRSDALGSELAGLYTDKTVSMPTLDIGVAELPESGWGIQLIKSACDDVSYRRSGQTNLYELTFDLASLAV